MLQYASRKLLNIILWFILLVGVHVLLKTIIYIISPDYMVTDDYYIPQLVVSIFITFMGLNIEINMKK